jgi:hypothetical protein
VQDFLRAEGLPPDFGALINSPAEPLRYIHKTLGDREYYFVSNPNLRPVESLCTFRMTGRAPELWKPESGKWERVGVYRQESDRVSMPLRLESAESVFVLFRKDTPARAVGVTSVGKNGKPFLAADPGPVPAGKIQRPTPATNTFTYGVWVRPAVDTPLLPEANIGIHGYNADRNDALFPPPAFEVFDDYRTSSPGLCVGRNGVVVFEGSNDYFVPLVVQPMAITNWTHLAVVYESGQPSLYVNGQFTRRGLKSSHQVHGPIGLRHGRGVHPFRGDIGVFQQFDRALSGDELQLWINTNPPPAAVSDFPVVEAFWSPGGSFSATAYENGTYTVTTSTGRTREFAVDGLPAASEITGVWNVDFPSGRGTSKRAELEQLVSWSDHPEPAIKYFSGTAVYRKTVIVPAEMLRPGQRLFLDLGRVEVMAEVTWNQQKFPVLWKPPFRVELTDSAKIGENHLQVEVVNLWANRLIGDENLTEDSERNPDGSLRSWPDWIKNGRSSPSGRTSFTTWKLWKASEPLEPSGLLGPVKLVPARVWTGELD